MATVTISPKFQIVIPKEIREQLGFSRGQEVEVIACGDRIELVPVRPARRVRGFIKGLDTRVSREEERA